MKKYLAERGPKNLSEVPKIAILCGGGGFRAMVYQSGVFCALKDMGVLDCTMYATGLSGGNWFLSMLYSHPEWPMIHPEVMRKELRDILKDNWLMEKLFSPSWLLENILIIEGKRKRGQPTSFTDLYGYLVGDVFRVKRKDVPKLSDQQRVVKDALVPFPIYNCIHVKTDVSAEAFAEWVEYTPYEIGLAKYGTFVKTEQFGNKFFCGKLVSSYKEPPIHFLEGCTGSVFAVYLQRFLDSGKSVEDTAEQKRIADDLMKEMQSGKMVVSDETLPMGGTEGSDNEDEHWDDDARAKKQLKEHDREKTGKEGFDWEALMEKYPVLKTREGRAGIVHNFLRGLQLPSTPGPSESEPDQYSVTSKRMYLVDSGLHFADPYPMFLMTPQRAMDILLSFETAGRDTDDGMPFWDLLRAEEWAKKNNFKFPPLTPKNNSKSTA
ncbi:Cytosolic phospholipase A2 [Desmophyllum pertusum]|uniref:Cytosolic phospholipase A2 n=1 Tax=Desmophyllum pertusum TaxID=174260 RepID=A0A9X0CIB0_9CNID|nr:Cytosolic phospholipase A2 [Desmophyllum pertusum]